MKTHHLRTSPHEQLKHVKKFLIIWITTSEMSNKKMLTAGDDKVEIKINEIISRSTKSSWMFFWLFHIQQFGVWKHWSKKQRNSERMFYICVQAKCAFGLILGGIRKMLLIECDWVKSCLKEFYNTFGHWCGWLILSPVNFIFSLFQEIPSITVTWCELLRK